MKQKTNGLFRGRRKRRMLPSVVMLITSLAAFAVWASAPETEVSVGWADEQQSVRELMRLETRQALFRSQQRDPAGNPLLPGSDERNLQPELTAIYGVGEHLTAEVRWGSERYRFRQGQSHQRLTAGGPESYMLQAFSVPCVAIIHNKKSYRLCLASTDRSSIRAGGRP